VLEKIWLEGVLGSKLEIWKVLGVVCKYKKSGGLLCKKDRGVNCDFLAQGLIEYSYHQGIRSFFGSPTVKNSRVKRVWLRAISRWVIDREVFLGVHK
jgi:hypothetical protein